ncbi:MULTISPECIES: hypothetical protein, partial [Vibrio]|uniref:hypothetical protein n=1 Tax=Vibrio TaxID=662 RepID=UPI001CDBA4E3
RLQPCLLKIYSNMVVLWGNYEGIPQNFMCFDAFKSGVVSKRLLNETTWNKQRRRKRTDNTKKSLWKANLTVQTFNKVTGTTWNLQHQRKRHFSE